MTKHPTPTKKFDLIAKSAIIRAEKPSKALDAQAAPNPNQMNRVTGFLETNQKAVVAQRHGKGGMDFNKIVGGRVLAVAADGFSPVFEKGADRRPTTTQKTEGDALLFSASGFYTMSTKDYPALQMFQAYVLLRNEGEKALILRPEALEAPDQLTLESDFDLELLECSLGEALADEFNLVEAHNAEINKKRMRGIERAKQEAEDAGEDYAGVEYSALPTSHKDGTPFLLVVWSCGKETGSALLVREAEVADEDSGLPRTVYFSAEAVVSAFLESTQGLRIRELLEDGQPVQFGYARGHVMRTSVSFRRKVQNVITGAASSSYGDGVFIAGAQEGWCKALVSVIHSQHPTFPATDYDALHYVIAPRQAEVGMNRKEPSGWTAPQAPQYDLESWLVSRLGAVAVAKAA